MANGATDPTLAQDVRHSRFVALNQLAQPIIVFGLVTCAVILVACAGVGMIRGVFDAASFVAVASGLFGILSGALGLTNRAPQRSTDSPSTGQPTVTPPAGGTP